jgi:transcriptional regulator with XRE-family HTH domain
MAVVGRRIKSLRERHRPTQGQLAVYSDVAQSHVGRLKNGLVDSAGSEPLARMARVLDTTTDYLPGLSDNPVPADNTSEPSAELEWALLEEFRKLDSEEQRYALAQLRYIVEHMGPHRPRIIGDEEGPPKGTTQERIGLHTTPWWLLLYGLPRAWPPSARNPSPAAAAVPASIPDRPSCTPGQATALAGSSAAGMRPCGRLANRVVRVECPITPCRDPEGKWKVCTIRPCRETVAKGEGRSSE